MDCKSVYYNEPTISARTCSKFCSSSLLCGDSQQVTQYYALATFYFFALFIPLISVYLGTFGIF